MFFELSYFDESNSTDLIPTGWAMSDEDILPRLGIRIPKPAPSEDEEQSSGTWENSDKSCLEDDLNAADASP